MNYNNIDLTNKKALFIDCDGTIADTMPSHHKAYELAFLLNDVPFNSEEHEKWAPYGGTVLIQETILNKGYGQDIADSIVKDKQKLLPICLKKFMKANEQLVELIKNKHGELKIYIVSNGRRNSITEVMNILGITYYVDGLVTKELVSKAKPNPEPYIYTLQLSGLKPNEVIVFEDNQIGIDAAHSAGISSVIKVDTEKF